MTFSVQYFRYYEEFGWNDVDYVFFDNLKDAWAKFLELKAKQENEGEVVLLQGNALTERTTPLFY